MHEMGPRRETWRGLGRKKITFELLLFLLQGGLLLEGLELVAVFLSQFLLFLLELSLQLLQLLLLPLGDLQEALVLEQFL